MSETRSQDWIQSNSLKKFQGKHDPVSTPLCTATKLQILALKRGFCPKLNTAELLPVDFPIWQLPEDRSSATDSQFCLRPTKITERRPSQTADLLRGSWITPALDKNHLTNPLLPGQWTTPAQHCAQKAGEQGYGRPGGDKEGRMTSKLQQKRN